jgi:ATP-dependent RNA helicase DeaD
LLGEDKAREAEAIPEDRRPLRPAPDRDHTSSPRRSSSRAEAGDRSDRRHPDPAAKARRERGRDEYGGPKRSRPREEAGPVSHESGMVRLAFNVGRAHAVQPGDFVGVITGVTAIPKGEIGAIHLQDTKTFVDVAEPRVALVLKKLNGIKFKERKLLVRVAV